MKKTIFASALFSLLALGCAAPSGAAAPALAGTSWMMALPKGADCEVPPEVKFLKDGRIEGNAGCNDFGGSWKQDGDRLTVKYEPKTNRNCAKAFLEPEKVFAAGLRGVASVKPDGKGLLLLDAAGKTLVRVVPAEAGACD